MKHINRDEFEEAKQAFDRIQRDFETIKNFCRGVMTPNEYERFKREALAHSEPGLFAGHDFVLECDSIEITLENISAELEDQEADAFTMMDDYDEDHPLDEA